MQVILVATDETDKLRPLTEQMPAPMVPVVNRPVMAIAVEILARAGTRQLLVSVWNRSGAIRSYFGTGKRWGIQIEYVPQREAWGTAGALRWAGRLLHETFLMLPADEILDLDIEAALAFHRAHGGPVTAIVHGGDRCDVRPVHLNEAGQVAALGSDSHAARCVGATGAYIFEPQVLKLIPPHTPYDVYNELLPALLAAGTPVSGYVARGYWNPLRDFRDYQAAQQVFLASAYPASKPEHPEGLPVLPGVRYPSIEGRQLMPGVWVGLNTVIHPTAVIVPPVCIGENAQISRNVEIGPFTTIGSDVVVDESATARSSVILDYTYVGQLVNLENRVVDRHLLINACTSESTRVVDSFLLSGTRPAPVRRRGRRLLTILTALSMLLLLSPLMLVVALIVLAISGGRLLTRIPAVGQHADPVAGSAETAPRSFELVHFATRQPDNPTHPIGLWLERWDLHRLPEIWNLLLGDIELVGVKPLHPAEASQLHEEWHQKRFEYPAGLTGLWYVQTEPHSDLDSVIVADVYYVATRSWRDDLYVLLRTPGAWLRRARTRNAHAQVYYNRVDTETGSV